MTIPLYQVDAFAEAPFQGNPAAVCLLEEWLPDAMLQAIAEENNLSETAFLVGAQDSYELRWFTPTTEVDLCGHATLAAAHVLFSQADPSFRQLTFHSRSGVLQVSKNGELLTLDFPALIATPCAIPEALSNALGTSPKECYLAVDYLAVFDHEEEIRSLAPNFALLRTLDYRGVIVTAPGEEVDFVSRYFAPNFGIDEDPVTGSAHCTLAPYWAQRLGKQRELAARQLSKRTGALWCASMGERVLISGRALSYLEGVITLS